MCERERIEHATAYAPTHPGTLACMHALIEREIEGERLRARDRVIQEERLRETEGERLSET